MGFRYVRQIVTNQAVLSLLAACCALTLVWFAYTSVTPDAPVLWSSSCSDFNGQQSNCQATSGCSYPYPSGTGNCSDFDNNSSQCASASGCSYPANLGDCGVYSNIGASACTTVSGCSYPANLGNCSTHNGNSGACTNEVGCSYPANAGNCTDFNGQQSTCQTTSGCSYPGNTGSCSGFGETTCSTTSGCSTEYSDCANLNGSESSCTSTNGCSWDGVFLQCIGSYFSSCNGSYDDGSCTGNYDNGICTGNFDNGACVGGYDTGACVGTYNHQICTGTYDNTPPAFVSATASGNTVAIVFDEPLDENSVPLGGNIIVTSDGSVQSISAISISGSTLSITLDSYIVNNVLVTVDYTVPGSNPIQDLAGNDTSALSGQSVTNNSPPRLVSVSSNTPNGAYTVGDEIDIDLLFDVAVDAPSDLTVTLETGATDRDCVISLSNETTASCTYTVQAGDTSSDLDVASMSGLVRSTANAIDMVSYTPTTGLSANKNIVVDTTDPTISITAPVDAATVSGASVALEVSVSDTNLAGVQFKRATNTNIGTEDTTDPYSVTWDTTALADGDQTLIAVARDAAGNYATSSAVTVTISNPVVSSGASGGGSRKTLTARCVPSDTRVTTNDVVTFEVSVTATEKPYTFTWTKELEGSSEEKKHTFTTPGTYYPRGRVKDARGATATLDCGTITVLQSEARTEPAVVTDESEPADTLPGAPAFVRDLSLGSEGADVLRLQQLLNTIGFTVATTGVGSPGQETTYFGLLTQQALQRFQLALNIVPGMGLFSGLTRDVLILVAIMRGL